MTSPRRRLKDDAGYATILVALLVPTVFLGLAALGIDTARWYVEVERVQKAADAAALAGVTYMPADMAKARRTAETTAQMNGYAPATGSEVVVEAGAQPSQLRVTITTSVHNSFGSAIGSPLARISRSAVADYTAPAPMGSPCNTFGNEPPSTPGAAQPVESALPPAPPPSSSGSTTEPEACVRRPKFWAAAEGPETDKMQGDRYNTRGCNETGNAGPAYGCANKVNSEYREDGYFFTVNVTEEAARSPLTVQIYDPAFINTGIYCNTNMPSSLVDNMSDFTPDGKSRYGVGNSAGTGPGQDYCSSDTFPGKSTTARATTTTFVMRGRTDSYDPLKAQPISGCTKQFRGSTSPPTLQQLKKGEKTYSNHLAQIWHQWYALCTFTPPVAGNYFLQVRTNVAFGGVQQTNTNNQTSLISTGGSAAVAATGNTSSGAGANGFALRVVPQDTADRDDVAVSAWERMPVLQTEPKSTATFYLLRALTNSKGQYLTFDFFDAADGANGTVTVLPPADAVGTVTDPAGIPDCKAGLNDVSAADFTPLTGCRLSVNGTHTDGQVVRMIVPIPSSYGCTDALLNGCWFRVRLQYDGPVTDLTTWSANIGGDPVRLVE